MAVDFRNLRHYLPLATVLVEILLLIERDNTLYPIEFKKTTSPNLAAAKHFAVLEKLDKQVGHGAVFCDGGIHASYVLAAQ